jgi:hypothetical protein
MLEQQEWLKITVSLTSDAFPVVESAFPFTDKQESVSYTLYT